IRRLCRDHSGHRRVAAHLRAAARPHREDRRRGEERRPPEGEAARGGRARPHAIVPEGSNRTLDTVRLDKEIYRTAAPNGITVLRSEERRVGKECRSRRGAYLYKKK